MLCSPISNRMAALALGAWILLVPTTAPAEVTPPEGIPRQLASERAARVSGLHYHLAFQLLPAAPEAPGSLVLDFLLSDASESLLLDYRDGALRSLTLNGQPVDPRIVNGHVTLPAPLLLRGTNTVRAEFAARVAAAGTSLTRFSDTVDHSEYLYTLLVPMDASALFPCFDQPDLKGQFELELTAPQQWTVISNTDVAEVASADPGQRRTRFRETPPLSTYVFAFAAGPFRRLTGAEGQPGLYVRQAILQRAQTEAADLPVTAARGIAYLSQYFDQPFPFAKYDMVLIPGFPFGGMEHAGATFLREEAVVFRQAPTHRSLFHRDVLVLHELAHQWFGDMVTMRWFDDLWLKEGFAQYMAYQTLATLRPDEPVWKNFHEDIKPLAYAIDATQGTTPIYQAIGNLKDAKSAYGAIVYEKAPAVMRQLSFVLGEDSFRDGLRRYLLLHAYSNANWEDLVAAFEHVSGHDLGDWAERWIRHRGMPEVRVHLSCTNGRVTRLALSQRDVLGTPALWPLATQLLLEDPRGERHRYRVALNTRVVGMPEAQGQPCPRLVWANDQDFGYGRFLLDPRSQGALLTQIGGVRDPLERTLLWDALWDGVRQASLAPTRYVELAQTLLPAESDEAINRSLFVRLTTALHRYVSATWRRQHTGPLERLAGTQMQGAADRDLRIVAFRALQDLADTPEGLRALKRLLRGDLEVPGVELRPLDRWTLLTVLVAHADPEADALVDMESARDVSGDGAKFRYITAAARPEPAQKQAYFRDYLDVSSHPEDWIVDSLPAFNYWNQTALTEPFVRPALDALGQIKRERRIFFTLAWLAAFLEDQRSPEVQAIVDRYLATPGLADDLRLKILQERAELDRTVAISTARTCRQPIAAASPDRTRCRP